MINNQRKGGCGETKGNGRNGKIRIEEKRRTENKESKNEQKKRKRNKQRGGRVRKRTERERKKQKKTRGYGMTPDNKSKRILKVENR